MDDDPLITLHARRFRPGNVRSLEADLRDPAAILAPVPMDDRPVGLPLVAVVLFPPGQDKARDIVRTLIAALPPGRYLAMSCATTEFLTPETLRTGRSDVYPRDRASFAEYFAGLGLLAPGIVPVTGRRPGPAATERPAPLDASLFSTVARRP